MGSRFVQPESIRLPLSQGDWIAVKKRLTAGEQRQHFGRMVKTAAVDAAALAAGTVTPSVEVDVSQMGLSTILAYLLDWSFPEMVIRHQSTDVVTAALDALDTDTYNEILAAVTAHEAAMTQERAQEKKLLNGVSASSETSPSPNDLVGAMNGSPV